jgi:hypothetical protein
MLVEGVLKRLDGTLHMLEDMEAQMSVYNFRLQHLRVRCLSFFSPHVPSPPSPSPHYYPARLLCHGVTYIGSSAMCAALNDRTTFQPLSCATIDWR